MPELDTNISDLWWLNRKNWLEGPDRTMEGIRLGAQIAQQKRQYALDLVEHSTREKEADVRMHNAMLDQQLKGYQLEDMAEIKRGTIALQQGRVIDLNLTTHQGAMAWQSILSNNELAETRASASAARNKTAAKVLSVFPSADDKIFKNGRIDSEALDLWSEAADNTLEERAIRLRQATSVTGPPEIVTVDNTKYVRNPKTGALHIVPRGTPDRVDAVPIYEGESITGYGIPDTKGGVRLLPQAKPHPLEKNLAIAKAKLAAAEKGKDQGAIDEAQAVVDSLNQSMHPKQVSEAVKVGSKQERDRLLKGTHYIGPDGNEYIKE